MAGYQYLECHFRDFFQLAVMIILKKAQLFTSIEIKDTLNSFFKFWHSPHPIQLSTCQRSVQEKINLGNMQCILKNSRAFK